MDLYLTFLAADCENVRSCDPHFRVLLAAISCLLHHFLFLSSHHEGRAELKNWKLHIDKNFWLHNIQKKIVFHKRSKKCNIQHHKCSRLCNVNATLTFLTFYLQHLDNILPQAWFTQHMFLMFYWLAMSNSCVNPIVYYWMNKRLVWCKMTVWKYNCTILGSEITSIRFCKGSLLSLW